MTTLRLAQEEALSALPGGTSERCRTGIADLLPGSAPSGHPSSPSPSSSPSSVITWRGQPHWHADIGSVKASTGQVLVVALSQQALDTPITVLVGGIPMTLTEANQVAAHLTHAILLAQLGETKGPDPVPTEAGTAISVTLSGRPRE